VASAFPMAIRMASRAQGPVLPRVSRSLSSWWPAPIGDGSRSQLNIYEQINDRRPCFASSGDSPGQREPLLEGFDFSGILRRYLECQRLFNAHRETDLGTGGTGSAWCAA